MDRITVIDRLLLLFTALLAAYQVVQGIDGFDGLAIASYSVAFGVLLIASLLLMVMGLEVLDSPVVVIVSTIIPLSLSLGLISQFVPDFTQPYLVFVILGFLAVVLTRSIVPGRAEVPVLALVHGIAGMVIFLLPIALAIQDKAPLGFLLVSLGGALIGVGGLLLAFLKSGKPLLSRQMILRVLPTLLFLTSLSFTAGFAFL